MVNVEKPYPRCAGLSVVHYCEMFGVFWQRAKLLTVQTGFGLVLGIVFRESSHNGNRGAAVLFFAKLSFSREKLDAL